MIIRVTQSGKVEYGIRDYYLDTPSDLESLKLVECKAGSSATIISTGQTYLKNSAGQWILQPISSSGGGSGSDPSTEDDIVVINETTPASNNDDIIVL